MQKTKRYYFFYKNYNTRNKINKKNIITLQKTKYLKTKKPITRPAITPTKTAQSSNNHSIDSLNTIAIKTVKPINQTQQKISVNFL